MIATGGQKQRVLSSAPQPLSTWLNVSSHLDPKYGGICTMLPELCRAVSDGGEVRADILGFCDAAEKELFASKGPARVAVLPPGKLNWAFNGRLQKRLAEEVARVDGVHIHGLWEEHCFAAAREARRAGKPYVLAAHGMLEPWALRNKRFKKVVYSWLTERENVSGAACLHALTPAEADDYRRFGAQNPIAVIPNGVDIPDNLSSAEFLDRYPELRNKSLVLFLGRIHYKKGLDILVEAWRSVAAQSPDAHLVIAGPDFENTRKGIEDRIQELNLGSRVTFTGLLTGSMKWSAITACDVFVLPSYSEGLSVSVLEAMGAKKPVIVTRQCNIPEVEAFGCGWVIEPEAGQLISALNERLRMPAASAALIGENGQRVVKQLFAWDAIGAQMRAVYQWVLGGQRPSHVVLL